MRSYKKDFPVFAHYERLGRPLVYLDTAACAQMPQYVIDAVAKFSIENRANVHRGIYALSEAATDQYEDARRTVRDFLNARSEREIIFTRNTTEGINMIACALVKKHIQKGDHILVPRAEHHSNLLPWQQLAADHGVVLDCIDVDNEGMISLEAVDRAVHSKTRVVAFSYVSNMLGTINSVHELGKLFRDRNILFILDVAQAAAHIPIDVEAIGCDVLAMSGYKLGAPMGIGVLYGREELLSELDPVLLGGGMIERVETDIATWHDLPWKFEAGTPNVDGAVGLAAAIQYINEVGFDEIGIIEQNLNIEILKNLSAISGVEIYGPKNPMNRGSVVSFTVDSVHPHDLATILDRDHIAIRAGHHCTMPLHKWLGVSATVRASYWLYNTVADIEALAGGIEKAKEIFKK